MAIVLAPCFFLLLSLSSSLLLALLTYDVAPSGPGGDVMAVGSMRFLSPLLLTPLLPVAREES